MSYYDNFVKSSLSPNEAIKEQMQASVDSRFEVSSTFWEDIEIEDDFGTLEFRKIEARLNRPIDYKSGSKVSEDYRKILFQDLSFKPSVGTRFRFDNNIWIVYSINNIRSLTSSAYIRRCNNTMNFQDEYGNIHCEPCFLEENLLNRNPTEDLSITTIKGNRVLYAQHNQWTKYVDVGKRFMFGKMTYKVTNFAEIKRTETFSEDSIKLFTAYIDIDGKNEYDRIYDENGEYIGVADYKDFNYSIALPDKIDLVLNETGNINAKVLLNGETKIEELIYQSSDMNVVFVNPDTGDYKALSEGQATILVSIKNKPEISSMVLISIVNTIAEKYNNIILPSTRYIPVSSKQSYEIYETLSGLKTDTGFTIQCKNLEDRYFELEIVDKNNFIITNKRTNPDILLEVICTNNRDGSEVLLYIELGGLF